MRNLTEQQILAIVEDVRTSLKEFNNIELGKDLINFIANNLRNRLGTKIPTEKDWSDQDNKLVQNDQ